MAPVSALASQRTTADGRPLEISFIDIKKAYFDGVPKRRLHLVLPRELGMGSKAVAHLRRCVYGTRDAGMIWEDTYTRALTQMGFRRGLASPCCFWRKEWGVSVVSHGDGCTALGPRAGLKKYQSSLEAVFEPPGSFLESWAGLGSSRIDLGRVLRARIPKP